MCNCGQNKKCQCSKNKCGDPCGCKFPTSTSCVIHENNCLEFLGFTKGSRLDEILCGLNDYLINLQCDCQENPVIFKEFRGTNVLTDLEGNKFYIMEEYPLEIVKIYYEGVVLPSSVWEFSLPNRIELNLDSLGITIESTDYFRLEYKL